MSRRRTLLLVALVGVLALAACSPGAGAPSPSPETPTPTESPEPSATPSDAPHAITIDAPADGETVAVPFTASGTSNTFEAALTIDVIDESGLTACVRQLTATAGNGVTGTWEGMLAFPPEEDPMRVTIRAYAFSPKDGAMIDLVEYRITIPADRPDIIVTNPRCGDVYPSGTALPLRGTARLFEAALTVELRDARGVPVVTLPVTAAECCVESQFSATLAIPDDLPPGWYDVVAYSLSAKDGSVENVFSVQVEITDQG